MTQDASRDSQHVTLLSCCNVYELILIEIESNFRTHITFVCTSQARTRDYEKQTMSLERARLLRTSTLVFRTTNTPPSPSRIPRRTHRFHLRRVSSPGSWSSRYLSSKVCTHPTPPALTWINFAAFYPPDFTLCFAIWRTARCNILRTQSDKEGFEKYYRTWWRTYLLSSVHTAGILHMCFCTSTCIRPIPFWLLPWIMCMFHRVRSFLLLARRRWYFMTSQDNLRAHLDICMPLTSFWFVHCVRCRCYRVRTSLPVAQRLYFLLDLRGTLCSHLDIFVSSVSLRFMSWILHLCYRVLVRTKILEPPIHLDPATNYFTPSIEPPGI